VVATAAGAVPEVVGTGAVLVAPGDGDGLAAAINRVLDGGSGIEEQVARGLRRSAEFTWEACAAGLAGLYRDACSDGGGGPGRGPLAPSGDDGRSPAPAGPRPEGSGP
jgi:glycosyltransferase involved in cell wall biosynthesis